MDEKEKKRKKTAKRNEGWRRRMRCESASLPDEVVYINVARFYLGALVYVSPIFSAASERTRRVGCKQPSGGVFPRGRDARVPTLFASGIRMPGPQLPGESDDSDVHPLFVPNRSFARGDYENAVKRRIYDSAP